MTEILFREESYNIIGICTKIHAAMGIGLKEINYKDAMEIEFIEYDIPFERGKKFTVKYKEHILKNPYIADFIVFDSFVLEIKSVSALVDPHIAQSLSYLTVSKLRLAILINFGERSLKYKRILL